VCALSCGRQLWREPFHLALGQPGQTDQEQAQGQRGPQGRHHHRVQEADRGDEQATAWPWRTLKVASPTQPLPVRGRNRWGETEVEGTPVRIQQRVARQQEHRGHRDQQEQQSQHQVLHEEPDPNAVEHRGKGKCTPACSGPREPNEPQKHAVHQSLWRTGGLQTPGRPVGVQNRRPGVGEQSKPEEGEPGPPGTDRPGGGPEQRTEVPQGRDVELGERHGHQEGAGTGGVGRHQPDLAVWRRPAGQGVRTQGQGTRADQD